MSHYKNCIGISAKLLGMVVSPADRLGNIAGHFLNRDIRYEAIIGRDENEAFVHESLRLLLNASLVALSPAASMNPKNNRMSLSFGRCIDIEHLPLIFGLDV